MQAEKPCRVCGETKPLTSFWAYKRTKDGRSTECATCAGERRKRTQQHGPKDRGPLYVEEDRGYETPCWVWQRALGRKDYGVYRRAGRWMQAHKAFYVERYGPIPEGLTLDHLCRVHACVNPEHLEPVTNAENCRRGSLAKLTWDDVDEIRASSQSASSIAPLYGVHPNHIYKIRAGQTWTNP